VACRSCQSQEVAGYSKSDDLPAAIRQQLVAAHDALTQIVEGRREFLLYGYHLARHEMDVTTQMIEFPQFGPIGSRANAKPAHRAIGTNLLVWAHLQPKRYSCATLDDVGLNCMAGKADRSTTF
jgi:hypothetical protein